MTMNSYPPDAVLDARNRALRTLLQGALVDVATAVALVLTVALTDIAWTRTYWLGIAALVAKTAITAAVSYVARRVLPPVV